jgi:hypothetical protein
MTVEADGMECDQIRAALTANGKTEGDPEVQRHLEGCAPCRALLEDGAALGLALGGLSRAEEQAPNLDPAALDALCGDLAGQLERERGPLAWLRSSPTWLRLSLCLLSAGLVVLGMVLSLDPRGCRPDLSVYPTWRMATELTLLVVLLVLGLVAGLRPLHRPPLPRSWTLGLLVAAVLLPLTLALLPAAHAAHPMAQAGGGEQLVPMAWACFWGSALRALPTLIVALLVARQVSLLGGAVIGVAGAGTALLIMHLHCPVLRTDHQLIGHVPVALVFVGSLLLGISLRTRLKQRHAAG